MRYEPQSDVRIGPWATAFLSFACPFLLVAGLSANSFQSGSDMETLMMLNERVGLSNSKLESDYERAFYMPGLLAGTVGLTFYTLLLTLKRRRVRGSDEMIDISLFSNK
jgi:hypothetical protein